MGVHMHTHRHTCTHTGSIFHRDSGILHFHRIEVAGGDGNDKEGDNREGWERKAEGGEGKV